VAAILPIRPLRGEDDRDAFDCGREAMNAWFRRHAWNAQESGTARVNIIVDSEGAIIAYVALSASQIERAFLPKSQQRNRPEQIPVTLLGQLAVDTGQQGQGHAASLLQFALRTAFEASKVVGSFGIVTHPLDESVRGFYRRFGFENLPFDPRHAMIMRMADLRASIEAAGQGG
jgi:predicted N-acetyltransferase YhbS